MALQIEKVEGYSPILSVPDGEPTAKVPTDIMLSVEHLEMIDAPDRPDGCTIYGYFRVSDKKKCDAPFTLFNRERNQAVTLDLGDPRSRFVPLSDDRRSARPVFGGSIFYVQLKLWEITGDEMQPDPLIVDVDIKFDDFFKSNRMTFLEFEGNFGFKFSMAYAHIFGGIYVKVQFTILEDIVPRRSSRLAGKRRHPMLIYGSIGATQGINDDEVHVIEMFYAPSSDPVPVEVGSSIELQREFVVALTGGGCLGIAWTLVNAANGQELDGSVPFRFQRGSAFLLTVPENLTYTQKSRDGLVSVSLTFVPCTYPTRSPDKSTQVSDVCESES